jgi:6-phosphogluconate dehydrogenase
MIGLGRMGANMVRRLAQGGHECVAYDRGAESVTAVTGAGTRGASSLAELVRSLKSPRAIWIMVPAAAVDALIAQLSPLLAPGDVLIDGGNSNYQDDIRRAAGLAAAGVHYLDVGTSGGVLGLEQGYCLMIGGEDETVARLEPVFATLAPGGRLPAGETSGRAAGLGAAGLGYLHCGPHGAGHFVKMVHNGIEYGLMAAYAEGLNLLAHADAGLDAARSQADAETAPLANPRLYQYRLDLAAIAEVWRHGSIVASRLLDLTAAALARDARLEGFAGRVADSGEGRWTVQEAIDLDVPAPVITLSLLARFRSRQEESFGAKVIAALRNEFGGHAVTKA